MLKHLLLGAGIPALLILCPAHAQELTELPVAESDPMAIDPATDPVLSLQNSAEAPEVFRAAVAAAVARNPSVSEAEAMLNSAEAEKRYARAGLFPDVQIGFNGRQTITREFSNDPDNVLEQSRSLSRYDATASVEQTLLDFGATSARIRAAGNRLRAAAFDIDATAEQVALGAVAAWYDVYGYRQLVALGDSFIAAQTETLQSVEERIAEGVNAPGDLARAQSSIARAQSDLSGFRRQLASAEARYREMIGSPPPPGMQRAPEIRLPAISLEMADQLARTSPQVEAAREEARAVYNDGRAARAETLPRVTAGVDAGYYGVFDPDPGDDYDVRARVSVTQNFFTGSFARADASEARADAAQARAEAVEEEMARQAAIAWADVDALNTQLTALGDNYMATRRTRDVLSERFRYARGTLFDVLESEDTYFAVAARYIQALTERDAARYVLLARTGRLLDALGIDERGVAQQDAG